MMMTKRIKKNVIGFICDNDDITSWSNEKGFNRQQLSFVLGCWEGYLARACREQMINCKVVEKLRTLGFDNFETFDRRQPEQITFDSKVCKEEPQESFEDKILNKIDEMNSNLDRIATVLEYMYQYR